MSHPLSLSLVLRSCDILPCMYSHVLVIVIINSQQLMRKIKREMKRRKSFFLSPFCVSVCVCASDTEWTCRRQKCQVVSHLIWWKFHLLAKLTNKDFPFILYSSHSELNSDSLASSLSLSPLPLLPVFIHITLRHATHSVSHSHSSRRWMENKQFLASFNFSRYFCCCGGGEGRGWAWVSECDVHDLHWLTT